MSNKKLIIVESPNKIQTIKSYLTNDYEIIASYGHLREMDTKYGYNKETYEPNWTTIKGQVGRHSKTSIINQIKKSAKEADTIYLATDPDREGEAISWHIYDLLPSSDRSKCQRITFNEISKKAIVSAIENKHELDMNLVYSQFSRRIIDRLVGYKLSNLVRSTVNGKSAGRVQSVALMFIVSKELERQKFVPSKWYEISGLLDNGLELSYTANGKNFKKYTEVESSKYNFKFADEKEAIQASNSLGDKFTFINYSEPKETKGDSYLPLTTDKMLQIAGTSLGWSANKTTSVAQKLFEGVEINGKHLGLITYPRTDSERINSDFILESQQYLTNQYGKEFVNTDLDLNNKKTKRKKQENVQDAHEAIRPVDPSLSPSSIKGLIDDASYRLYSIIWSRTMAIFMRSPIYVTKGMFFDNNGSEFFSAHKSIKFLGYLALEFFQKTVAAFKNNLPDLKVNEVYQGKVSLNAFDKQPPAYFTEATLIAALKDSGVGRPSTYAAMAKISETRGYVNKDGQKLIPTDIGMKVIAQLQKDFPDVIDSKFTSHMENELDKIANGSVIWTNYLQSFAPAFEQKVKEVYAISNEEKKKSLVYVDRDCPKCGSPLIERTSKYGSKFIACSAFPKCRYAEFDQSDSFTGEICPECGGKLVKRFNKKHQMFVGCGNYPNCKYIKK